MMQRIKLLVTTIFIFSAILCFGQDNCYQTFYQKGEAAFQKSNFDAAIKNFKAAKVCPDKPSNNDIDEKIVTAQNGFINAIQKERKRAQSLALTAKSILELQKNNDATRAFRYAKYALKKDDNSESRSAFYEAAYQLESQEKRLVYSKSFKAIEAVNEYIRKVDFTRRGKYITVYSSERIASTYDLEGNKIASKRAYNIGFDNNSFGANDAAVAFIGKDGLANIYNFPKAENDPDALRFSSKRMEVRIASMTFSTKEGYLAIGYQDGLTQLFKSDGTLVADLEGHGKKITSLSFSKDDSLLVTGNEKGIIGIWKTDGSLIDTLVVQKIYDSKVVISPDKNHLLISSSRRRARLLTIEGKEIFRTSGYFNVFSEKNFSKEGDYVAITNNIYSLKSGISYGKVIETLPDWVENVQFSKNDKYLLVLGSKRVAQIWKRGYGNKWNVFANLGGHSDEIASASFSPDGKSIVTASYDSTVKIWPVEVSVANSLYNAGELLRSVILEDSIYAITHKEKDVYLWNAVTGYKGYYGLPVDDVITQSKDGKLLLTVEGEMTNIWNFEPFGDGIINIAGISAFDPVRVAKFSNDKKAIALFLRGDLSLSLTVWDLVNHNTRYLGGYSSNINTIEWAPDGKQLLIGNADGEVIVWNYELPLAKMEIQKKWLAHDRQPISDVAVSPDGKIIATASWDKTVKLWNADFEYLLTLRGHNMEINTVSFSLDSRFIITASEDRTAKIWDAQGQLIVTLEGYPSDVKQAYFSTNMKYVILNYGDDMVKFWPFEPALVEEKVREFTKIDLTKAEKEKYGVE